MKQKKIDVKEFRVQAAKTLAMHEYKRLAAPTEIDSDFEAWRCARPNTSIYAFDLIISRYGMAVYGDIDGLIFRVGSTYGLDFLAFPGGSLSFSYMCEKLEQSCIDKEFDRDRFINLLVERVLEKFEVDAALADIDGPTNWAISLKSISEMEPKKDERGRYQDDERLKDIASYLEVLHNDDDLERPDDENGRAVELGEIVKFLEAAERIESSHDAYALLYESGKALDLEPTDITLERVTESFVDRMMLVSVAAEKILNIKAAEAIEQERIEQEKANGIAMEKELKDLGI